MGGDNHFQYAPNPVIWIDQFGLSRWKPTQVLGRKVYQSDTQFSTGVPKTVDPKFVHPSIQNKIGNGATNLDLMKKGNAPIGVDGRPINLHHVLGQEPGPMVEIKGSTHSQNHRTLHGLIENGNSFRNDPKAERSYNRFRKNYWKERAKQLSQTLGNCP